MVNVTTETPTTVGSSQETTMGQTVTTTSSPVLDFIKGNSVLFFGLFLGTAFILISIVGIIVYRKHVNRILRDSSHIEITSMLTCNSVEECIQDKTTNSQGSVRDMLRPSTSDASMAEEVDETEPQYDYPEIFQLRLELETHKCRQKALEPENREVCVQNSRSYLNLNNNQSTEDDSYLVPRAFDHPNDTDDRNSTDQPIYDDVAVSDPEKPDPEQRHGYVGVKPEMPRSHQRSERIASKQKKLITELQRHLRKPTEKLSDEVNGDVKTNHPCCSCCQSKRCRNVPRQHRNRARGAGTNGKKPVKITKRRYENIPD